MYIIRISKRKNEYNTKNFSKNTGANGTLLVWVYNDTYATWKGLTASYKSNLHLTSASEIGSWYLHKRREYSNMGTQDTHTHNMFLNIYGDFIWKDKHWKQKPGLHQWRNKHCFCSQHKKNQQKEIINCWHPASTTWSGRAMDCRSFHFFQ